MRSQGPMAGGGFDHLWQAYSFLRCAAWGRSPFFVHSVPVEGSLSTLVWQLIRTKERTRSWASQCIVSRIKISHARLCRAEAWWLDGVTQQMVEQQLNLGRALTFTLRAGHPIVLTREQVRVSLSTVSVGVHFQAKHGVSC